MALLDFIKNRDGQRPGGEQQNQPEKPATAREQYVQQAAADKAALKPLDTLPEQPRAELNEVKARMEKATQHLQQSGASPAPAPGDATASPEPQRQNMSAQDKAAPELSPTSMQAGKTVSDNQAPAAGDNQPQKEEAKQAPAPAPTPDAPARGRGGWER